MRNHVLVAVGLTAAALAVAACSSNNTAGGAYGSGSATGSSGSGYGSGSGSGSGYGSGYGTSSGSGTTSASGALRAETTSAGTVLASGQGMTLYYYTADKPGSGTSACTGGCASAWPPLTGTVKAPSGVKLPGPIGSITRSGGVHQVTINGYPVYTYAGDKGPGQATGNGEAGEWHVIRLSSGSGASSHGGMLKVELTSIGKVLANPHGMTVYYYSEDKPGSGVSACTGACASAWPPVVAPVRVPAGAKLPGPLGQIILPDGVHQVTLNGYPLYRYAGDMAARQVTGNGKGGEWHVIKL
jgi:predicted lipoprotein with Yx(FWY)xxD motif